MTNTIKWTIDGLTLVSALGAILYGVFVYKFKIDRLDERLSAIEALNHVEVANSQGVAGPKVHPITPQSQLDLRERHVAELEERIGHDGETVDLSGGTPPIKMPDSKLVLTPTWFTQTSPIWILDHQVAIICTGGFGEYRGSNHAKFRVTDSTDRPLTVNGNPKTLKEGEFVNFSYRKMRYRLDVLDLTPEDQKAQVRVVELAPEP